MDYYQYPTGLLQPRLLQPRVYGTVLEDLNLSLTWNLFSPLFHNPRK
jgi:hypothetical protein